MYGLQLQTQYLSDLHHFYSDIIGLPILDETQKYFRTQIGTTVLDFEQASNNLARYCFRIGLPIELFNEKMNNLSARVSIKRRRSVFHPKLKHTWYFRDPSNNIVELSPFQYDQIQVNGIAMLVKDILKVGNQLQSLGLSCKFTDSIRCILENPDDGTNIVLIQTNANQKPSMNQGMTIPTLKSSINATICVRDTPHFLYMVTF